MSTNDYTLLIPYFDDYDNLVMLLKDIHDGNLRDHPQQILIIDDGSYDDRIRFIHSQYSSTNLPPIMVRRMTHQGPYYAETYGLSLIKTPYTIVCHSDTRLLGNVKDILPNTSRIFEDVLSVLSFYIHEVAEDGIAVGCHVLWKSNWATTPAEMKGMQLQNVNAPSPLYIVGGMRGIGIDGIPFPVHLTKQIESLKAVDLEDWQRVYSLSNYIYALNMKHYNEMGGFDEVFAPYGYYHDDFFGKCRMKGLHCYFTQDTVAYHPYEKEKPQGSLSTYDGDRFIRDIKMFRDKWSSHKTWTSDALNDFRIRSLSAKKALDAGII